MNKSALLRWALLGLSLLALGASQEALAAQAQGPIAPPIRLRSRQFTPPRGVESAARAYLQARTGAAGHVIVQFDAIPSSDAQATLAARGIRLLDYLPERAWFAAVTPAAAGRLDAASGLRWAGLIEPADRLSPLLRNGKPSPNADGTLSVYVRYFADVSEAAARAVLTRHRGVVAASEPETQFLSARLPAGEISALAAEDTIRWITPAAPPPTPMNDTIRAKMRVNDVQAAPYNLNGAGVMLGIWDCGPVLAHPDFGGRLTVAPGQTDSCGGSWHSTHVAGTIIGDGTNSVAAGGMPNQWRGMAPGSSLVSYDFLSPTRSEIQGAINTYGMAIGNNSWGILPSGGLTCTQVFGNYDTSTWAPLYDQWINGLVSPPPPMVFAAGNEQNDPTYSPCSGYGTVIPPGTAKNVMTVGATNVANDSMSYFSSWGPTDDGRLKPDVVAPGYRTDTANGSPGCTSSWVAGVKSTCANGAYGLLNGTSMSAPAVSGMFALMLQQYRQLTGQPTAMLLPSTFKALAIQGAVDLGNTGPDYQFGWGRVDAKNSVDLVRLGRWRENTVAGNGLVSYRANVLSCDTSLKVTLAWDDAAGSDNAAKELVNDLDLTLTDPSGNVTIYPWVLSPTTPAVPATRGVDTINNVEQVLVNSPAIGGWTINVFGASVPVGPTQKFSVVSEALNTPILSSLSASSLHPGDTLVLHGVNFEQGCSAQALVVNFGGGALATVPSNAFTRDTITVTVPANADSGLVSVTTPAATSNGLYLSIMRPRVYLPAVVRNFPPPYGWLDASGGTRIVNGDEETQTISLPFAFPFYGNTYTTVNVSSNGFINFGSLDGAYYQSNCIPTAAPPNNAIYGYWADLVPNDGRPEVAGYARAVWAGTVGGLFVIEWQEVPRYSILPPAIETFEIVLYPQGYIVLQYQTVNDTSDVVVGVENATGGAAIQRYCNVSNPPPGTTYGTPPTPGDAWLLLGQ